MAVVLGVVSLAAVGMGLRPFVMISESMLPEDPKNSLVLLDTRSKMDDVAMGDNVAYLLGKVEAMHKVRERTDTELIVRSLADNGESTVTASTYMGKDILSILVVGGWNRKALDYMWIMIIASAGLIVFGCMPKKA